MINELTTNSIRHGLREREELHIHVRFSREAQCVLLEFRDDGPGYPEDVLVSKHGYVGVQLLQSLVENDLNGSLEFRNDHGAVTSIFFNIPF